MSASVSKDMSFFFSFFNIVSSDTCGDGPQTSFKKIAQFVSLFVNLANIMKVFIFCEENVSVCPSDVCLYFHIEQLRELHYVVCQV